MRNYALDTKMLPKVWLTWETNKDGRLWLNCQNGKLKKTPEPWMAYDAESNDIPRPWVSRGTNFIPLGINWYSMKSDNIWVTAGSSAKYAYAKYHADIDKLEIAAVGMNTKRTGGARKWEFIGNRFFIGKDKSIVEVTSDCKNCKISNYYYLYKGHTACSNKEIIRLLLRLNMTNGFTEEFKKFIGTNHFVIGNGTTTEIKSAWHLSRWYETSQKPRGKGKQQKLVDSLTKIELSNYDWLAEKYPPIEKDRFSSIRNITYYEKINDEWSVLRSFIRSNENTLSENWRVYIGTDGTTRSASKSANGWIPSKHTRGWYCGYTRLVNKNEAIANCPRIKYILQEQSSMCDTEVVDFIVSALRFPEIEQLTKLGYGEKAKNIANSNTVKADLKNMFGGYFNEKEKTLLKRVGLNKHQLDFHMKSNGRYTLGRNLKTMREIFGNNLSHIDNESFDKYYEACETINSTFYRKLSAYIEDFNLDYVRFFKNLVRLAQKHGNVYQVVKDTLSAYSYLDNNRRPEVDWYFDDYSDLTRMHDVIYEIKRVQDEERRALYDMQLAERRKKEDEKRKKLDEERKIYEYADDKFTIRLPIDINEIVQEGAAQHICIGGYTTNHAFGHTNLFFLRRNDEPEKPFYAIEMNNNKVIVQIHGFGNRWLGNNPEAIPTVVRWLRKHNIKCSQSILTCKSTGYCSRADYVPMPVVD